MKVKSWEKKIILLPDWERRKEKSYASFKNFFFFFEIFELMHYQKKKSYELCATEATLL